MNLPTGDPATAEWMAEAKRRVRIICECGKEVEGQTNACPECWTLFWMDRDPLDPEFQEYLNKR